MKRIPDILIRMRSILSVSPDGSPLLLAVFYVFVMLFSSCEDAEERLISSRVAATFTPYIDGGVEVGTSTPASSTATRASGTTWAEGDQIGIYMIEDGANVGTSTDNLATNIPYKTSVSGTNTSLVPVDTEIYYPVDGSKVNFVAYYPYSNSSIIYGGSFPVDVSDQSSQSAIDFLYHKGTKAYSQHNAAAALNFKHGLSKVFINVTRGTGISSLSGLSTKINGVPYVANISLIDANDISIYPTPKSITPYTSSSGTDKCVYEAILIPHTSSTSNGYKGRSLTFTIGSNTYTYPIEDTQNFDIGYVYTYDLILTSSGVALREVTITDWVEGAAWNKNYTLTTATNSLTFEYNETATKSVVVKTNAGKPTVSTSNWISATVGAGTQINSAGMYYYPLTIAPTAANSGTSSRASEITLSVAGLTIPITVTQKAFQVLPASTDGMSNCYIVAPNSGITFPVTRAYTGGVLSSSYTGTFTVSTQWQDATVISSTTVTGTGRNAYITVKTTADVGNALIVLKQGATVVWSYHIWVTDYNPTIGATWTNSISTNPRRTFMDRNLGGAFNSDYGLFYQWGRKDPFPYVNVSGWSTATGGVSMATAVKNPHIFYRGANWHETNNNYLWCTSNKEKTIYDPCPIGWCVPTAMNSSAYSPWHNMSGVWINNYGYLYYRVDDVFYWTPSGYYDDSGNFNQRNSFGVYWAVMDGFSGAYYMAIDFVNQIIHLNINETINKGYGSSVRCVKE